MATPETKKDEQGLNDPKSNEELFERINKAVSEGDETEVNRLFEVGETLGESDTSPDAKKEDDQTPDPTADKAADEDEKLPDSDPDKDSSDPSVTTGAAPDKVAAPVKADETPDTKALLDEIHRLKSAVGRVDYLQQRLNQLERDKKKAEKQQAEKPAEATTPAPRKSDERIKELRKIDSDMADTLELIRDEAIQEAQAKLTQQKAPERDETDPELEAELERIRRVHPDTDQIFFGQARPVWDQWKASLTPEQRAWAESDRAEEVSAALFAFKQAVAASQQQHEEKVPEKTPASEEDKAAADSVTKARERKLQGSTDTKNTTIKTQGVADVDKMFSDMYKEIEKRDGLLPSRLR